MNRFARSSRAIAAPGTRRRVYIYAYTATNLGDDLLILRLCEEFPEVEFLLLCAADQARALSRVPNLRALKRSKILGRLLHYAHWDYSPIERWISTHCDAIVNIGGSIFIQHDDWRATIDRQLRRIVPRRGYFIVGANFGPWDDPEYRDAYSHLFERATDVCFRDRSSRELFKELDNVRYAPDAVLSYRQTDVPLASKSTVVISVIDLSNRSGLARYREEYERKMAEIAVDLAKMNFRVVLMSNCAAEGDDRAASRVMAGCDMGHHRASISNYSYTGDIDEALNIISTAHLIVSTRLHSMILGWLYGKPVFPIVYSGKILRVMEDAAFRGQYSEMDDLQSLSAIEVLACVESSPQVNITQLHLESCEQFSAIRRYLVGPSPISGAVEGC